MLWANNNNLWLFDVSFRNVQNNLENSFLFQSGIFKVYFLWPKMFVNENPDGGDFQWKDFHWKKQKKTFFTEVKCQHLSAVFRSLTTFLLFFFISI